MCLGTILMDPISQLVESIFLLTLGMYTCLHMTTSMFGYKISLDYHSIIDKPIYVVVIFCLPFIYIRYLSLNGDV